MRKQPLGSSTKVWLRIFGCRPLRSSVRSPRAVGACSVCTAPPKADSRRILPRGVDRWWSRYCPAMGVVRLIQMFSSSILMRREKSAVSRAMKYRISSGKKTKPGLPGRSKCRWHARQSDIPMERLFRLVKVTRPRSDKSSIPWMLSEPRTAA